MADKYLRGKEGEILHTADGRPMLLDNFDQDPSPRGRAEALAIPDRELWEMALRAGVSVPDHLLESVGLKKPK
jgi:hypothetical protein